MKVLVTCVHLIRHFDKYKDLFSDNNLDYQLAFPDKQQFDNYEMLNLLPGNEFIIAGDDEITNSVIKESLQKGLKAIIKWGIGVDNIDIVSAKKYGVPVFNTPNVFGGVVAEQALSLILNLFRGTHIIDKEVRRGNWCKIEGISLMQKKLGIIGFGSIGKAIAERACSFGMKVSFFDPFYKNDICKYPLYQNVGFEEICKESECIVLACSLNSNNKNLINKKSIGLMENNPLIINVSRGQLINEKDLIKALKEGKISGAGLDVFEIEPLPINSELMQFRNCIFGSHNSSNTIDSVEEVNNITTNMVIDISRTNDFNLYKERRVF